MFIKFKNSCNEHLRLIIDDDITILNKIINKLNCKKIKCLNIGGGYKKPNEKFLMNHSKIEYFTLDIQNNENQKNLIVGDITDKNLNINNKFDIIYSSDTFEHILNPWDATENIKNLLNNDGILFIKIPFSWRYHACPYDTYRYSHTGIRYLMEHKSEIKHLFSGYKKMPNTNGWYKDKTDVTIDGKPFTQSIETYYIGMKDKDYKFSIDEFDKGYDR